MRTLLTSLIVASLVGAPAQAHAWLDQSADVRPGTFMGARVKLSLGGNTSSKPRAELTLAPSTFRISGDGSSRTSIGQGLSLGFRPGSKPTLTLGGIRADHALHLSQQGKVDAKQKLGLSTGAWVGIGVVAAVVVGVVLYSSYCDRKLSSICGDSE